MLATTAMDTRLHPFVALRAVRRLLNSPDDTRQVFILLQALRGRSGLRLFRRFCATPAGRAILAEHRVLLDRLQDQAGLAALPAGSLGRAYLGFMQSERLSAAGLVAVSDTVGRTAPTQQAALFRDRMRDMHDLSHVMTGYGRDPLGELCLSAFTYAQTRHPGLGLLVLAGLLRMRGHRLAVQLRRAVIEAYRRGRAAAWLPGQDWESLLGQDLADLQARLLSTPPAAYRQVAS